MFLRFNTTQIKLISIFILLAILIIGGGYYYLNSMRVINGGLNIGKIDQIEKVYGYSIYSDFYFRITKHNEESDVEAEYSKLIPIKTKLGIDLKDTNNPRATINSTSPNYNDIITLSSVDGEKMSNEINALKDFSSIFGNIVSTQDDEYFNKSIGKISKIYAKLYNKNLIITSDMLNSFYSQHGQSAVSNISINHFILNNSYLFNMVYENDWGPNIAEWDFGDNNRVYLQYLTHLKDNSLDDYVKNDTEKNNTIVIRTTSIHQNILQNIYIKIIEKEHKIQTLFLDNKGYLYALILTTKSKNALSALLSDYLKIAFGVHFIPTNSLNINFIKQQEATDNFFGSCLEDIKAIYKLDNDDDYKYRTKLYNHFNIQKIAVDIQSLENSKYDLKMKKFKDLYGSYPSKSSLDIIKTNFASKQLIKDTLDNIVIPDKNTEGDLLNLVKAKTGFFDDEIKVNLIINECSKLECLKNIKENNWEVVR